MFSKLSHMNFEDRESEIGHPAIASIELGNKTVIKNMSSDGSVIRQFKKWIGYDLLKKRGEF